MRCILSSAPLDFVDLFFNFEGLQVIEFGLVRLEFGMEFILAGFFLGVSAFCNFQGADNSKVHTVSFLSKSTTLPPLSPVAR